jgi:hypothetical protein
MVRGHALGHVTDQLVGVDVEGGIVSRNRAVVSASWNAASSTAASGLSVVTTPPAVSAP